MEPGTGDSGCPEAPPPLNCGCVARGGGARLCGTLNDNGAICVSQAAPSEIAWIRPCPSLCLPSAQAWERVSSQPFARLRKSSIYIISARILCAVATIMIFRSQLHRKRNCTATPRLRFTFLSQLRRTTRTVLSPSTNYTVTSF